MKILIVSQYFWPESFLINDLVDRLAKDGHTIVVATGKPNYPVGEIYDGYTQHGVQIETFSDKVTVFRIPMAPRHKGAALNLIANYLSFAFSASLRLPWLLRRQAFDVVFVFAVSPLTAAIPAIVISKLKKAHLALWIQDLWPDSLSATGFVRNRGVLGVAAIMVRWIYYCSNTLLVQSKGFIAPVSAYANKNKIVYFPNFAPETDAFPVVDLPDNLSRSLNHKFTVVFAGNMGKVQSLSTILAAARILESYGDIRIVLVGTGSEAENMMRMVNQENLGNVHFTGPIDRRLMPAVFKQADALLVTLAANPALIQTIPSKIQSYMQAGRPIIGSLDGEGASTILTAGAGLVTPAEDGQALATSILTLYSMPAIKRNAMGIAARAYFEAHFELNSATKRLVEVFTRRMKERQ